MDKSIKLGRISWVHKGRELGARPHPIPPSDSSVETNVTIPLRDGTSLRGDLYLPTSGKAPYPAILEVTPYGAQTLAGEGRTYASRGYLFLAVDCRGRYRSEGEWEPLTHEREDGHEILAWLEKHPSCNGRIGTRGHSYSGYNQLLTAIGAPASLQAMAVGVAPGDPFYNAPFQGGAYDLNDLFWLLDMTGRVASEDDHADDWNGDEDDEDEDDEEEEDTEEEKEHDYLTDYALTARPFGDVDLRLGIYHGLFREWIGHWALDDYWDQRSVLPHVERIDVPVLHITGLWDGDGRGATQFYEAFRKAGGKNSENQKLLIGAWNHGIEAPDCDDLADAEIAMIERAALRNPMNEEMAWFDHHLKDLPLGTSMQSRVEVFLSGLNRWYKSEDWPLPEAEQVSFHLSGTRKRLKLSPDAPQADGSHGYTFDPENPTPYGHEDTDAERMPFDNSQIQSQRKDLLLFDSERIVDAPLALVGPLNARIFASADTPDYDIVVSLYDVYPDGRSIFLADGILRARFQKSLRHPEPVPENEMREFEIDLWHIAHVFRPGHRLRLQIASGSYLRFDVNGCTGGDLARDSGMRKSRVRIYTGPSTPSRLVADALTGFTPDHPTS